MKKWIYLNLFIDNDWDEKKIIDQIYHLKLSSSEEILRSYTHLGIFLGEDKDQVLIETPIDKDFLSYLQRHFTSLAHPILYEGKIELGEDVELLISGVSAKEKEIFADSLEKKGLLRENDFIKLNRKDFLLFLARKLKFSFPESEVTTLEKLNSLKENHEYCLKFLTSAGGRGVFKVTSSNQILNFIMRQIDEEVGQVEVLKQEMLEIEKHFYTVAHTDDSLQVSGFSIEYDEKGNSKKHTFIENLPANREILAGQIGAELKKEGYLGSFGFDGVTTIQGREFPAIDLNVRMDKSRVFSEIIKKMKERHLWQSIEFRRERCTFMTSFSFKDFYEKKVKLLEKGEFKIVILLCSNLFNPVEQEVAGEVTFLLARKKGSNQDDFNQWVKECYSVLGIN